MANTYTKIFATTVGSGGAASIDFQNIPDTFDDLLILGSFRSTGTEEVNPPMGRLEMIINNTTTGNLYTVRLFYGTGTAVGTAGGVSANRNFYSGSASSSNSTANTFSNVSYYLPNYTSSTNKNFTINSVSENNGSGVDNSMTSGIWGSSAVINRITLKMYSGTSLAQHSTAKIYGIKKA